MNRLSVVIPTYGHQGRTHGLLGLLESLSYPNNDNLIFEIVIIDNGGSLSEDDQFLQIQGFEKVRVVIERNIGLNYARNKGISSTSGDIVAFIDDDCIASPQWAELLINAHQDRNNLCVGGPVIIKDDVAYPKWFSNYFLRFLLPPAFPNESGVICAPFFLIGANMSFKKDVFETYKFFDPDLDRKGSRLISGGDIEYILRIPADRVWFEKKAAVFETIDMKRLNRPYFVRRLFWQGVSDALIAKRRGINSLYDKGEITLSTYFIKKIVNASFGLRFFETSCAIIRLVSFQAMKLILKTKREGES